MRTELDRLRLRAVTDRRDSRAPLAHSRPVSLEYQSLDVAEAYDRRRFRSLGGRFDNWRLHRLLSRMVRDLAPGSLVLDVPCGTGRIERCLMGRSLRVIAADISAAMLTVAGRKLRPPRPGLTFLQTDAYRLPVRSQSVQAALCIRFLHLMDPVERRDVLTELARVAQRWVIVEYRNIDPPIRAFKRAMLAWLRGADRPRRRTVSGIEAELRRCGLVGERYHYVNRWFSGSVLVAAAHRPRATQLEASDGDGAGQQVPAVDGLLVMDSSP